jgi:hypothetical protein
MATAYVTEYEDAAMVFLGNSGGTPVPTGKEPALVVQKITYTTTAGVSAAFNAKTRLIRVLISSTGRILVSTAGTSAATTDTPVIASSAEYFGVVPGDKISIWEGVL